MSEYLRHTADHVSWLIHQKRREIATTRQLADRISQILQRRGVGKGLIGVLGSDEVRRAAGMGPPPHAPDVEPRPAEAEREAPEVPEPEPIEPAPPEAEPEVPEITEPELIEAAEEAEPEALEVAEPEAVEPVPVEMEPEVPEVTEPEPIEVAAEAEPEGPEAAEPEPAEPPMEAVEAQGIEPVVEEPPPEPVEAPAARVADEVELDIKEAAAEAAAVEDIPTEFPEPEADTEAGGGEAGPGEAIAPDEEAAELADVVAEIQGVSAEREEAGPEAAPGVAPAAGEVPFESALEPRALIPPGAKFASSADEVVFNRAIDRLGAGEAAGVREAIKMLGSIGGDAAAGALMNLYRIAPQRWRLEVAHRLVNHGGAGITAFFCRVLDEKHDPAVVRVAALRALYAQDKALAADYLLKAVADPSDEVRAAAATYLGWLRDQRAVPLLEQLIHDGSRRVAKAALHAASAIRA